MRYSIQLLLLASIVLLVSPLCLYAQPVQTYYPSVNVAWKNIVTDYGAKGDGVTDDTKAFRKAVETYLNQYNSTIGVYIPNGTYLVSDSIQFLQGYWDCHLTLQGQDPERTIIKLKDNSVGFQDTSNPRAMLSTRAGNQAFGNYMYNLTVNTGLGNAGAVGVDYITSNYGAMRNVRVVSPDGGGYCGVRMERAWPGPGLLKNVEVDGFQYGIRVGTCEYSMTFEDITLKNQKVAGMTNACNTICIRHLTSTNVVPAIKNANARVIIVDSKLNGGGKDNYGVEVTGYSFVFARNLLSEGYAGALSVDSVAIQGNNVVEYHNSTDFSRWNNDGTSLGISVEETPNYVNNNQADWADVTDFGATPTNPIYSVKDITKELQAALNSGKKVIYLGLLGDNGTYYCVYSDITIPPTVEMITGFNLSQIACFNNSSFVVNETGSSPLFIERMKGMRLLNNSQRTVVFRSSGLSTYFNTEANRNGKVFIEDWVSDFQPKYPVQMWARQFNPEIQPEEQRMIDNPGGKYWILGLKTEGRATIARTSKGGQTEILGGLIYPASSFSGNSQAAFAVENACMTIVGLTMTSYVGNGWYGVAVNETNGDSTTVLESSDVWNRSAYNFGFYSSQRTACAPSSVNQQEPLSPTEVFVYPNPATGQFFVYSGVVWDRGFVYNSIGETVRDIPYQTALNLDELVAGVYWLKLFTPDGRGLQAVSIIKR